MIERAIRSIAANPGMSLRREVLSGLLEMENKLSGRILVGDQIDRQGKRVSGRVSPLLGQIF